MGSSQHYSAAQSQSRKLPVFVRIILSLLFATAIWLNLPQWIAIPGEFTEQGKIPERIDSTEFAWHRVSPPA